MSSNDVNGSETASSTTNDVAAAADEESNAGVMNDQIVCKNRTELADLSAILDEMFPFHGNTEEKLFQLISEAKKYRNRSSQAPEFTLKSFSRKTCCSFDKPLNVDQIRQCQELLQTIEAIAYAKDTISLEQSFAVDTSGCSLLSSEDDSQTAELIDTAETPKYELTECFANVPLSEDLKSVSIENINTAAVFRVKNFCFNCGDENHAVKDCAEPMDQKRIAKNRKAIQATRSDGKVRYHGIDEKFSKYKAGTIGKELREALSLGEYDQLPWISRMRALGYPPGYLLAAKSAASTSKLQVYDENGDCLDSTEMVLESNEEPVLDISLLPKWTGLEELEEKLRKEQEKLPKKCQDVKLICRKRHVDEIGSDDHKSSKKLKTSQLDIEVLAEASLSCNGTVEDDNLKSTSNQIRLSECHLVDSLDSSEDTKVSSEVPRENGTSGSPKSIRSYGSLSKEFGTPTINGSDVSRIHRTPDLALFAAGIQPFLPTEERPPVEGKGFRVLNNIMKKFRKVQEFMKK